MYSEENLRETCEIMKIRQWQFAEKERKKGESKIFLLNCLTTKQQHTIKHDFFVSHLYLVFSSEPLLYTSIRLLLNSNCWWLKSIGLYSFNIIISLLLHVQSEPIEEWKGEHSEQTMFVCC